MTAIVAFVRLGPTYQQATDLVPGFALLRHHGPSWPLGIDSIEVKARPFGDEATWRLLGTSLETTEIAVDDIGALAKVLR